MTYFFKMRGTIILALILISFKNVTPKDRASVRAGLNIPQVPIISASNASLSKDYLDYGHIGGVTIIGPGPVSTTGTPSTIDVNESNKKFVIQLLDVVGDSIDIVRSRLQSETTTTTPMTTTGYQVCYYYYVQPDYYDKSSYYVCLNNTLLHQKCPSGGLFDYDSLTCGGKCIDGLTKEVPDPKPRYSNKYLECSGSSWVEKTCPPSKYYDQYATSAPCNDVYCYGSDSWLQSDPLDRTKYLLCNSTTNSWVEKSCGAGQIFDRYLSQCVNKTCNDGDTTAVYHFWDSLYMECGQLKSCPNGDQFWYTLSQCVGSISDLKTTSTKPTTTSATTPSTTTLAIATASQKLVSTTPYAISSTTSDSCAPQPPYYYLGYYQYNPYFQCKGGQWKLQNCPVSSTFYLSPVGGYCLVYEMCPYYTKKNFISAPAELPKLVSNGSLYYQCLGSGWYLSACPPGETFNPNDMNCSSIPNNYKNGKPLCLIGNKKKVGENSQYYYECDGFSWVAKTCPSPSLFDPNTNSCNYNCTAGSKKQLVQDGFYNDGSFYLECNGSSWVLKKCPLRLIFNVYSLGCTAYAPPPTKPTPKTTTSTKPPPTKPLNG